MRAKDFLNKPLESDQGISKNAETKFHKKLDTLVHSTFGKRKDEVEESAEELNVGDDVIITGPVEHEGETGIIDSFSKDKSFVVVNLYNHGKKSFHSSDVSYNDYADSDAEEAEMYDRDPEFRDWAARQDVAEGKLWRVAYSVEDERYGTPYDDKVFDNPGEAQGHVYNIKRAAELAGQEVPIIGYQWFHPEEVDEGWESGPDERAPRERDPDAGYDDRRQEKMDIEAEKENAKRPQEKVYTLLGRGPNMEPNYRFPGEYSSQEAAIAARERLKADPNTPNPEYIGIHSYTRYLDEGRDTPLRDREDYEAKRKALQDIQLDPNTRQDSELSAEVIRRLAGLEKQRGELK